MDEESNKPVRFGSWTSPDEEALVDQLGAFHPALAAMLAEHVEYHDEILSYLYLADVRRWASERYLEGLESLVSDLLALLERNYQHGDQRVRELIAVGFVEVMDSTSEPTAGMYGLLGPLLSAEYRKLNR